MRWITPAAPYRVPRAAAPVDLRLDGNEGATPDLDLSALTDISLFREYPDAGPLEAALAACLGAEAVLVTAGADDALDRTCRALLAPGREIIAPSPGFEMLVRYATLAGGTVVEVPWPEGPYPTEAVIEAAGDQTAVVVVTSPNNPTGAVATADDLRRLSAALPEALLLIDLAYVEFADEDLTEAALVLPNTLVVRTFSKAWGLAGLRVGYAGGSATLIEALRASGAPYPVSGPSLALAQSQLEEGPGVMNRFVRTIRAEREALTGALAEAGARPLPSQANFVLAEVGDALWFRDAMAGLGIAVRAFPGRVDLDGRVRIACPGDPRALRRLMAAVETVLAPEAILFDMDGVLADVSRSYRVAIQETCRDFGLEVSPADIARVKEAGDANDDWVLTWRLLGEAVPLAEVTEAFEARYQGGLWRKEALLFDGAALTRLSLPLAVVTGRPRGDAERFLAHHGIDGHFATVVCREDAPLKPDPAPVRRALEALGVSRAWMVGDTVDDVRAARAAGVLPLGVVAPGDDRASAATALTAAGAARVLEDLALLQELLP